jgi:hypothetical protein
MGGLGASTTRHQGLRRAGAGAAAGLVVLALAAGCGQQAASPEQTVENLRRLLQSKVLKGWKVSYGRDVDFPLEPATQPGDLVVYKTEKVMVGPRSPDAEAPADPQAIYYTVSIKPFIPPAEFPEVWKKNEAIRKEHERVLRTVANVPRSPAGQLMPRGVAEGLQVADFEKEYAALPPYDKDMPTHYYENVGLIVRDWRKVLVPVQRDHQQEMNQVYALIYMAVHEYEKR